MNLSGLKMFDNSDLQDKIMLRNKAFEYFDVIPDVLDLFCGQCVISNKLWSNISCQVMCIDKKKQHDKLSENINRITGDNNGYIYLAKDYDIIDCDAYGLVMPFIKKLANKNKGKLIFFTDGTPTRQIRFKNATAEFKRHIDDVNPIHIEYFLNRRKTAYYGLMVI